MNDEKPKIDNDINYDLRFLAQSEIRLKILSELNKCPTNIKQLVKNTKITYSSISNNIVKLEKKNYIRRVNQKYYVNPMTEVYFNSLMEFKQSLEMINTYDAFWDKHDINQLSIESIKNITDLKDSQLIETTPIDIFKTHNTIKKQIIQSRNLRAIFPYLHPEYPRLIERVLNNEGSVELIIPSSIFRELVLRINNNTRRKAIREGKLRVYNFKDKLNLYLTLCDESISLGLFKNDGSFDQNRILISDNEKSYEWANDLFNHIKKQVAK